MRESKFRVWDIHEGKMYIVDGFNDTFVYARLSKLVNRTLVRKNVILMQYTGIKDMNGVEICEGDILIQNNNKADLVQVCFGEFGVRSLETERVIDKSVGWYLKVVQTDDISKVAPFCYDTPLNNYWIERLNIKVIGNIYENLELLRGEE